MDRLKRSGGGHGSRGSARTTLRTVCNPGVPARSSNSVTSKSTWAKSCSNAVPRAHLTSSAPNRPASGPDIPASKRGFCRSEAASEVDPERGRPEMK
jgi:hypothetical protein